MYIYSVVPTVAPQRSTYILYLLYEATRLQRALIKYVSLAEYNCMRTRVSMR